ncbi:Ppx/GppA family phosphatase [Halalkalibacter okhensis]|uniref:Exopolyphosphatase n=1 Tax=Halalkalibacter okhensis TaxID=333138 RepID=A0A0B0IKK7_9BACI|nr:Ppx/GppA family phosphatase [Halalkalibacter okhensis]KHF40604.1 exopolyphosphatase [Halalkalibacter okhensis]
MKENLVALIDLGSNSIRLAVYKINKDQYKEVEKVKVSARLINYLDTHGKLSNKGLNLMINTLLSFKKVIDSYQISHVVGFATAVIRQSSNQGKVLAEINKQTGFSLRVLSEYEEAYYGFVGIAHSIGLKNGITIDTGGGSTEITLFQDQKLVKYQSFPFGTITLDNAFTKGQKVNDNQKAHLKSYLMTQFQSLPWLENISYPVIGIGGTAKSLIRIHQRKKKTNSTKMLDKDIEQLFHEVASLPVKKRSKVKGLSNKRKDIIVPGIQTILSLMEVTKSPYFIYSEKTIRDGVVYEEAMARAIHK